MLDRAYIICFEQLSEMLTMNNYIIDMNEI